MARSLEGCGAKMINKATYNRRSELTIFATIGAFILLRIATFAFDLNLSPFDCLMLGVLMAIGSFIWNFRPGLDLAVQAEQAKASSEDEFTRLFKLAAGCAFFVVLFVAGSAVVTLHPPVKHLEKAKLVAFLVPPFLAVFAPRIIAIFRLLADSYRRI
ncbi:hypothetical protein A6U87_24865 [Rhizobium sp. AC44/96]|uniref:hypothetical protein n=1 Tax=Rhizobium sp. AC44/96 TaxID=1841654 RepID=UPI000828570B|nr:hypothetical protein [Rhizobium sp. AC44/96]OCJ15077.1 hypothetical protein A6U87_24865 [Rhizobium sp. AC44/96]